MPLKEYEQTSHLPQTVSKHQDSYLTINLLTDKGKSMTEITQGDIVRVRVEQSAGELTGETFATAACTFRVISSALTPVIAS